MQDGRCPPTASTRATPTASRTTSARRTTKRAADARAGPGRHQRLQLQGVEGHVLSGGPARRGDARASTRSASRRSRSTTRSTGCRRADVLAKWAAETPDGFTFVLKAPQRITHQKRLKDVGDALPFLLDVSEALGRKRGPFLFQLPPNMKKDAPRLRRVPRHAARAACAPRSSSATRPGSTTRRTRSCAAAAPRCASRTWTRRRTAASRAVRARAHRVLGLPAAAADGLRGRRRRRLGRAHPRAGLGGRVRLLQARGRGQGARVREATAGRGSATT